jgi:MFS family permease
MSALASSTLTRAPGRWPVLLSYMGVMLVSQMLWLNFAPLSTYLQARYKVGDLGASALVFVFPLLYVVLSAPAGAFIDRWGYARVVSAGSVLMAVGAAVRIYDASFAVLLAGQVLVAAAQPFVVNGISKLVAEWFTGEEAAIATGLGTMGMFLGMAVGMAATPAIVEAAGLRAAMVVMFAISLIAALAFLAVARERAVSGDAPTVPGGFGPVLRDRRQIVLSLLSFLGLGVFNALTTWLEPILGEHRVDPARAGMVGGVMIVGGIVGAVVFPLLSDKIERRRPVLIGCAAPAALIAYGLCQSGSYALLLSLGGALGFLFLPAFALLLAISGEAAGAERAGVATSLLMLSGNAGGVVLTLLVPVVKGSGESYATASLYLVALLALTAVLATLAPETHPKPVAALEG